MIRRPPYSQKRSDLELRLAASIVFRYLAGLKHPHQATIAEIVHDASIEPTDVFDALIWMRAHGVGLVLVADPGLSSRVVLRVVGVTKPCDQCAKNLPPRNPAGY